MSAPAVGWPDRLTVRALAPDFDDPRDALARAAAREFELPPGFHLRVTALLESLRVEIFPEAGGALARDQRAVAYYRGGADWAAVFELWYAEGAVTALKAGAPYVLELKRIP